MPDKVQSPRASDRNVVEPWSTCDSPSAALGSKRYSHASGCLPFRTAVTVAGMDLHGQNFVANSHTEFIAPSGCSIFLKQALAVDDEIEIRIDEHEIRGHVAGKLKSFKDGHFYAIEFDAPSGRWDVTFPEAGLGAALVLHCCACDLAGEVSLAGVEALVYEATGAITRTCPRCCQRTRWREKTGGDQQGRNRGPLPATSSGDNPRQPVSVLPLAGYIEPLQPKPRNKNERKSSRIQFRGAKACVQTPVRGTDIVLVVNMSRDGLRFVSSKRYERGDWMKVAAPYTAGGNNIFVPAEIVRVHRRLADGMPGEYALVFRSS